MSIAEQLLEGVQSGAFTPGSPLPPERALAEAFGVSRGSVREAVRVLQHAGVLDVRTGSGTYVTREASSKGALLRVQAAATGQHSPLDVIAARRVVEPACAGLAATSRHELDLTNLKAAVAKHADDLDHGRDPAEADLAFHIHVGTATHNSLLESIVQLIVNVMKERMWSDMKLRSLADTARTQLYLAQHLEILLHIEEGHADKAASVMREHLDAVEAGLIETQSNRS